MTTFLILLVLVSVIILWYKFVYKPGKYRGNNSSYDAPSFWDWPSGDDDGGDFDCGS